MHETGVDQATNPLTFVDVAVGVVYIIILYGVKFPAEQDLEMISKNEISVMTLRHLKLFADPSDVSTPSCSITNDWKIQCSCDVTKAFSTRDRYSCQWFQNVGGQVRYISNTHCWI